MTEVEDQLRELAGRSAPAIVAPDGLAARVLTVRRSRSRWRRGRAVVGVVAVGAAALTGHGEYLRHFQPSSAMEPTVGAGQEVVLRRGAVPERGDVVLTLVRSPRESYETLSRVIGLPGEVVACPDDGTGRCAAVEVDGRALVEPYAAVTEPFAAVRVPAGQAFLMGDDRGVANDSRQLGPQRLSDVRGAVVARVNADGALERLPGTPRRPLPEGSDVVDPAGPVPGSRVGPGPG